jgi:hypothetical protein
MEELKTSEAAMLDLFNVEELEERLEMKLDWAIYSTPGTPGAGVEVQW